ncbi:MAG TPA: hypothetical protein VMW72_05890 [Sedimentisphaerales bacterium]|nr:hypothetical protein [Sedimentisphaerales bacterium]
MTEAEATDRQVVIRPRVIRGETVPNRAADCAVFLRKSFSVDRRLPSVPEIADVLGVKEPAVVQFENVLRKRGVLRGSHRKSNLMLAPELLISDAAIFALVASTLVHDYDPDHGVEVYSDVDAGPWDENTYTKIVRDRAGAFGFNFRDLYNLPELVGAGYLQGRPGCFHLNKQLWTRYKLIFIKIFRRSRRGEVGAEEGYDSKALTQSLSKVVGCGKDPDHKQSDTRKHTCRGPRSCNHVQRFFIVPKNHDVQRVEGYKAVIEWINCWREAQVETKVVHDADLREEGGVKNILSNLAKRAYELFVRAAEGRHEGWDHHIVESDTIHICHLLRFKDDGNWILEPIDEEAMNSLKRQFHDLKN